ncbi:MAG: aldehyde dehydrogenase family protein [Arachidicoccus sp.]|nr:aldehyde dehydrogenase family protein [Arachidicoccus sp.]
MQKAQSAFEAYSKIDKNKRAFFLTEIANQIEKKRALLVPLAMEESHLPEARLQGELTRTVNQLKMFAALVEEGSWVEAAIDKGNEDRKPLPKPDTRKMLLPIGPVVVFGASNFPFAFSTAGGDTASALAAGVSVVVKMHPGHPETSKLVFDAMKEAVKIAEMPEFTVQHLNEGSFAAGKALVKHPATAGVGFTGSFNGGRTLMNYAFEREKPIPVFAEMSSINPVVLYPEYLSLNAKETAKKLSSSITLGMGQFCTNPGLLLAIDGDGLEDFIREVTYDIEQSRPQPMLHEGIAENYVNAVSKIKSAGNVEIIADAGKNYTDKPETPLLAKISATNFLQNEYLKEEIFGPYSLLVVCKDKDELKQY